MVAIRAVGEQHALRLQQPQTDIAQRLSVLVLRLLGRHVDHLRRRAGRQHRRLGAHRRCARSEPGREHHPRLPIGLGSLVTLARRARPPDHASRAVVACLTQRAEQGAAADPCKHTGVVQVRCSRACRAPARAVAAGVAANGGRSLAGLRDAALIQVMSDALFRVSEAAALNVADVQRQVPTAAAPSRCATRKPTRKGAGTSATSARPPCSGCQRGLAPPASPPAGHCSARCLKDGATVNGRLGARSIRSIIASASYGRPGFHRWQPPRCAASASISRCSARAARVAGDGAGQCSR